MKKMIKEKYGKIYLLMLCGLLVSGAIVCSTNNNGSSNNGGGGGNDDPLIFTCPNGTEVTPTADNMPTIAGEVNCAKCNTNFTQAIVSGSDRMTCEPNQGISSNNGSGNEFSFVCPNGEIAEGDTTEGANVENCASCNEGFESMQVDGRTICQPEPEYVCPNGTAASGTTSMANVENCASCNEGFDSTQVDGRTICQPEPEYVCPNGTAESGTTSMSNVENCSSCNAGFDSTQVDGRTICQPKYVCSNGTAASGTTSMANVENCSSCNEGFGPEDVDSGARSICNALPIALWNAGSHDGDFGFDLCQNRIAVGSMDAIGSELRDRGYTKAVFFGSTGRGNGDYLFTNIGSDTDALALPAMGGGSVSDRNIVLFTASGSTVSMTNTFGSSSVTRTLGNVTNVTDGGGWQNGGADVLAAAGIGNTNASQAWSFSTDQTASSTFHCNRATSNSSSMLGSVIRPDSVDGNPAAILISTQRCDKECLVLCVAR